MGGDISRPSEFCKDYCWIPLEIGLESGLSEAQVQSAAKEKGMLNPRRVLEGEQYQYEGEGGSFRRCDIQVQTRLFNLPLPNIFIYLDPLDLGLNPFIKIQKKGCCDNIDGVGIPTLKAIRNNVQQNAILPWNLIKGHGKKKSGLANLKLLFETDGYSALDYCYGVRDVEGGGDTLAKPDCRTYAFARHTYAGLFFDGSPLAGGEASGAILNCIAALKKGDPFFNDGRDYKIYSGGNPENTTFTI